MENKTLMRRSAEIAYNMYYGAKRHFSSYEIVETVPTYFGIITTGIGVLQLAYPSNEWATFISVVIIIVGFAIWHLNSYSHDKDKYQEIGKVLTKNYYEVRSIYEQAKSAQPAELLSLEEKLKTLNEELQTKSIYKQVWGSGVFAHYKLFGESQVQWFVNELQLTFWKDKFPASLKALLLFLFTTIFIWMLCNSSLIEMIKACLSGGLNGFKN